MLVIVKMGIKLGFVIYKVENDWLKVFRIFFQFFQYRMCRVFSNFLIVKVVNDCLDFKYYLYEDWLAWFYYNGNRFCFIFCIFVIKLYCNDMFVGRYFMYREFFVIQMVNEFFVNKGVKC